MMEKVILSAHRNPSYHKYSVGSLVGRTGRQCTWSSGSIPDLRRKKYAPKALSGDVPLL
jgi:hypothetical protein